MSLYALRACYHEGIYYKRGEAYRGKGKPPRHFAARENLKTPEVFPKQHKKTLKKQAPAEPDPFE